MWFSRLLNVFRANRLSRDIEREIAFHLSEREDDLAAGGMPRAQARLEARRRFGNVGAQGERTRDADLFGWLDAVVGDVRYALRSLRWSKGFTVVAIASLALGIGANTAIFSLINAVMLRDLPVKDPQELVLLKYTGGDNGVFTNPLWEQVRDGTGDVFSGVLAYGDTRFNLAEAGEERRVNGLYVSGSYFPVLGVRAFLGRTLLPADDVPGCAPVAVVSHAFWQSRLGADPSVVGASLRLGGHQFQVVGVADPAFPGLETGKTSSVFVPLCSSAILMGKENFLDKRSWWMFTILARPKPELTMDAVNARLATTSNAFFANTPPTGWPADALKDYLGRTLDVGPSLASLSELRLSYARALLVLMVIVALVLLIACANVANLMLARSAARQRELAVRVALGAGRGRLIRQLFTEGLLLSLAGAALGVGFAWWGSRVLVGLLSTSRDQVQLNLSLDLPVLGFTVAVAVATALLFGLAPAWRAARVDPQIAMKAQGRGVVEGHAKFGVGKALVMLQVAMSLVLIAAAGLLLGSFRSLANADPGFRPEGVLVASADLKLPPGREAQGIAMQRQLVERLRALPGVTGASSAFTTPISRMGWNDEVSVEGVSFPKREDREIWLNRVWDGYFATLATPIIAGRDFSDRDVPGSPPVAIINETASRRFFPGKSALGQTFRLPIGDSLSAPYEVIGVVRDVKYRTMRDAPQALGYFAMRQDTAFGSGVVFAVHTDAEPTTLTRAVSQAILDVSPSASLSFTTMTQLVDESMRRDRLLATLSAFFGGLALLLAMIGLYGTMSYAVARRRNEIGIRIALGAAQSRVLRSVLGEVSRVVLVGVALGTAGALAATPLVATFLYGRTPRDPVTLAGAALVLATVALVAGYLPARRASRMDPMQTLREE
ncbi:MAG: ABC transporter permease [Cytophagaceae bacterium]|nr:ABC transporter permease [Gemmatimonadaceae bacterium]